MPIGEGMGMGMDEVTAGRRRGQRRWSYSALGDCWTDREGQEKGEIQGQNGRGRGRGSERG